MGTKHKRAQGRRRKRKPVNPIARYVQESRARALSIQCHFENIDHLAEILPAQLLDHNSQLSRIIQEGNVGHPDQADFLARITPICDQLLTVPDGAETFDTVLLAELIKRCSRIHH